MIRLIDFLLALFGLVFLSPVLFLLLIAGWLDTGCPLFVQQRVGRKQVLFYLIKFRTMKVGTASIASHLADASSVTRYGRFLRRTKLDELPQLWNVVRGDMSLVGPRPCLPSQVDLIKARANKNVFDVRPGITGLAQVSHIDMSTPDLLASIDAKMVARLNLRLYFYYLGLTFSGRGQGDAVK
jgi:lipopolysaccharide/colanic/teichoic acid biosynthesis glycosyltransferase